MDEVKRACEGMSRIPEMVECTGTWAVVTLRDRSQRLRDMSEGQHYGNLEGGVLALSKCNAQ